ncbi:MAG TPA: TetR/AcrR family transcriptional regulator C-terminal domain-containing protein [Actinocrinis sp.]|nr:TetR/AcrR family transcriptional regulator C-terminal domain-containing protein [Actinocrinis sp.]
MAKDQASDATTGCWIGLAHRYRAALLAHRDGARVVAGTYVSAPNSRAGGGAVVAVFCAAGVPVERAGWAAFVGQCYVLGHTIEEQALQEITARGEDWPTREAEAEFEEPLVAAALGSVMAANPPDRFEYGLELFLGGIRERSAAAGAAVVAAGEAAASSEVD